MRDSTLLGQIVEIALQPGVHEPNATEIGGLPFVFDLSVAASEVRITGEPGASIRVQDASRLFALHAGAPRVTLRGLTLSSAGTHVSDGELVIESCRFEGCEAADGGAIKVSGGVLSVRDTFFVGNRADNGGAVRVSGGLATFASCTFQGNEATTGGALFIDGSAEVTLSDGTLLSGNTAPGSASAWLVEGSSLRYVLPAPIGRWVESYGQASVDLLAAGGGLSADFP